MDRSQPLEARRQPPTKRLRWGWRWAAFLTVSVSIVGWSVFVRMEERAATARAAAARVALQAAARARAPDDTPRPWRDPQTGALRPLTRIEIAAHLFPEGEPPSTTSPGLWGKGDVVSWVDTERGTTWQFEFGPDCKLTGQGTTSLVPLPSGPPPNRVAQAIEPARQAWAELFGVGIGTMAWIALVAATFKQRGARRRSLAHLQAGVAISCLVAVLIDLTFTPSIYALSTHGPLFRAIVVTCAAGFVLLAVHLKSRRDPRRCRCGYDLTGNESGVCPECGTPRSHDDDGSAERVDDVAPSPSR